MIKSTFISILLSITSVSHEFILANSYLIGAIEEGKGSIHQPLFLTPLINSGQIEKAKQLSKVEPFDGFDFISHSGFITVDQDYSSNTLFWFIRSKNDPANDPVILFFNGGPGTSAMYGLFGEVGPFSVDPDLKLVKREFNWVDHYNVIFADIPIGTGYSFTKNADGYSKNDNETAWQIYEFIQQFFTLFEELSSNDFYLAFESYSAKPGLVTGSLLHNMSMDGHQSSVPIKFKGMVILSGAVDLGIVFENLGDRLFQCGLINKRQQLIYDNMQQEGIDKIDPEVVFGLVGYTFNSNTSVLSNFTGMTDASNLLFTNLPRVFNDFRTFVQLDSVRRRLHVGNATFHSGDEVISALSSDYLQSQINNFDYLLNAGYKIISLNGNLDLIVNPVAQWNIVNALNWNGAAEFQKATRIIWKVSEDDEEVAGYVTQYANYVEVMLRNAGHMVSHDQPIATLQALLKFINDESF